MKFLQYIQANFSQGRGGRAQAGFFFHGFTSKGGEVLATLLLIGDFDDSEVWFPPTHSSSSTLTMTGWEMGVTNEGKAIKSISCIGEGQFDKDKDKDKGVKIVVTRLVQE